MLLNVVDTTRLLDKHGIPLPQWFCSNDRQELVEAARILRKPWALKLASPDATHKTDKGLVVLNLREENALANAFDELQRRSAGLKVDCSLVQEQLYGTEFIIGGKKDSSFGQTILFGLGGTLTELYKDFSIRVTPVDEAEAAKMIAETKAAVFTKPEGFRGKKASERALADVLAKTSKLLEENPQITELDFNPVIANEQGAWVADARIVVENA
ncbi:MAG: acetate--CoA ligase family protein [Candidatus Micrarchaeota archaeon]